MGNQIYIKLALISCFSILFSCEEDDKNYNWLINEHDGNIKDVLGDEVQIDYSNHYVYLTSVKLNQEYGYLFMDRDYYENRSDLSQRVYDNALIIVQGKIEGNKSLKFITSFLGGFKKDTKKEIIPHLFEVNTDSFTFQYYEKYHRDQILDTIIDF